MIIRSGGRIGIHGVLGAPSSRRGYVAGMMNLDPSGTTIDGAMRWKLPVGRDVRFPAGLDTPLSPVGDRLPKATTPMGLFGSTVPVTKTLEFSESVFPSPVLASVTFGVSIKSTLFDAPITQFSTYPTSGKISGSVRPFGPTGARFILEGIVLPLRGEVYGSMRSATKISAIRSP